MFTSLRLSSAMRHMSSDLIIRKSQFLRLKVVSLASDHSCRFHRSRDRRRCQLPGRRPGERLSSGVVLRMSPLPSCDLTSFTKSPGLVWFRTVCGQFTPIELRLVALLFWGVRLSLFVSYDQAADGIGKQFIVGNSHNYIACGKPCSGYCALFNEKRRWETIHCAIEGVLSF